jgi:hypothetical protein
MNLLRELKCQERTLPTFAKDQQSSGPRGFARTVTDEDASCKFLQDRFALEERKGNIYKPVRRNRYGERL